MASHRLLKNLLLLFVLSAHFPTSYAELENPQVTIPQGTLMGTTFKTHHERNIFGFLGIPYAQPPIGNLRFANPVAADSWVGIRNANASANMCPQNLRSLSVGGDEDCLYINVYTPKLPRNKNSSLLPVMVYIHGGAFKYGSSSATTRGPEYLMDKDIIYVAGNYRLGMLGFLSTGDQVASGNWGLKDQVLALKWVQNNIAYFGGNPDQVTLFGESAGAASVHLLTLSDATIGLFQRYITQSGSALAPWAYRPRVPYSNRAFKLGEYVGCFNKTSDALISCLRTIDTSDIIVADLRFLVWDSHPDIVWGPTDEPVIEGAILTDSPTNLFTAGKIRDLPWILGVDRDEGLLVTSTLYANEKKLHYFVENFDFLLPVMFIWTYQSDSGSAWRNATKSYYFNNNLTTNTSEVLSNFTKLASDTHFLYPAHKAIRQQYALAKSPQYFYTFNYRGTYSGSSFFGGSTLNLGVAHSDELTYLFPRRAVTSEFNYTMSETDYRMVDIVIQLWTSFAINGTPSILTVDNSTTWEPYSTKDNYLRIGNESDVAVELQYSFFEDRMRFWTALDSTAETTPHIASENAG